MECVEWMWMMVSKQSRTTERWAWQGYGHGKAVGMAGMVCLVCVENTQRAPHPPPHTQRFFVSKGNFCASPGLVSPGNQTAAIRCWPMGLRSLFANICTGKKISMDFIHPLAERT